MATTTFACTQADIAIGEVGDTAALESLKGEIKKAMEDSLEDLEGGEDSSAPAAVRAVASVVAAAAVLAMA